MASDEAIFEYYEGIALATCEKTLLALEPISRMVPTTMTRITANMTAYSAMSCPCSSRQSFLNNAATGRLLTLSGGPATYTTALSTAPNLLIIAGRTRMPNSSQVLPVALKWYMFVPRLRQ